MTRQRKKRLEERLRRIYGEQASGLARRFEAMIGRYGVGLEGSEEEPARGFDERSRILITYGDSIRREGERPLRSLRSFLEERVGDSFSAVHLLPFFPYSSDDGFSVIDFREVDVELGDWEDIRALGSEYLLMFDLVLNHCSRQSQWFRDFVTGIAPARWYFLPMDPQTDLSSVVRPRPWPLLTQTATRDGKVHVWTTFSDDQIDLNWQNPDVLFEFLDILFLYLSKGCRIFRLDAVAFLWKEVGTSCIHLPQTHELVKVFREVLDWVAPEAILLTETNVPHEENVRYFGDGDEAHMVYNFSLPPLLLHALLRGDGTTLQEWLRGLPQLASGQAFFNFTASHDGIGVRPLQGILEEAEVEWLVEQVKARGGRVSMKAEADGRQSPYELNCTLRDALDDGADAVLGRARFLLSQAVALALPGVPGIYIHSLLGTRNDREGLKATGQNRSLNRKKWEAGELEAWLGDPGSGAGEILEGIRDMLRVRGQQRAFHPDGPMEVVGEDPRLLAFTRSSVDGEERLLCLFNLTAERLRPGLGALRKAAGLGGGSLRDVLSRRVFSSGRSFGLGPYEVLWLRER